MAWLEPPVQSEVRPCVDRTTMKILLIDTCGETGSIALADSDSATIAASELPSRSASERLLPVIRDLAATQAVPLPSLGAVVVMHGPGSFTGVRVGLSAAKGLCEALQLPLLAISRLAVLAQSAGAAPAMRIHPVLDAGRGEFYHGEYLDGVCIGEAMRTREELFAAIGDTTNSLAVVCEQAVAESLAALRPRVVAPPAAQDAFSIAQRRIGMLAFDDVVTIDANYLRRTDAEIFAKPTPRATVSTR